MIQLLHSLQVIEQYGSNQEVDDILNDYDFWFLPIGNPDGYIYSWISVSTFHAPYSCNHVALGKHHCLISYQIDIYWPYHWAPTCDLFIS